MTETQSNGAFDGPVIQVGNLDKICVAQVHRHIHRWHHNSMAEHIANSYYAFRSEVLKYRLGNSDFQFALERTIKHKGMIY